MNSKHSGVGNIQVLLTKEPN